MSDWAVVLATIIGPVAAVAITLWYQARERSYNRKWLIFRSLMQWRRNWANPDWVGALNLVPVEFNSDTQIVSAFNGLLDKLGDNGWNGDTQARQRAYENAETAANELLQKLAKNLSVDLTNIDLRSRVYAPMGWLNDDSLIREIRNDVHSLVKGETSLHIKIENLEKPI